MYLGIRTDTPLAELYLYDGAVLMGDKTWQADRQLAHGLLAQIETFLTDHELTFSNLTGLFVYSGPGSFTGLRIGITTMNTMAYALHIPIAGVGGDEWREQGIERLLSGETDQVVLPYYGADPRITKPIK